MINKKKVVVIGICVAVIAAVIIGFVAAKMLISTDRDSVFCIYDDEQDITAVYRNEKLIGTISGQFVAFERNMNDTGVYLTDDESTLYFVSGSKITKIGEELSLVTIANFSKEALVLDKNEALYFCNGKKLERITDEPVSYATISGDGKTYAYYMGGDSYFGTKPGKETKVEDMVIGYVSKDADLMYGFTLTEEVNLWKEMYYYFSYISEENFELYAISKDGEQTAISEEVSSIDGLNRDGTEIVFSKADGTYISVNGDESIKLSDNIIQSINYNDSEYVSYGHFNDVESVRDAVCVFADEEYNFMACYISDKYKATKIVDDCATVLDIDTDSTCFVYLNVEAGMCYAEIEKESKPIEIAENVMDGKMSPDGKHIYYTCIGDMMEIHYVDSDFKDVKVDEFENYWAINVVGEVCYLETNATYLVNKDEIKEIKEDGSLFYDYIGQTIYWQTGTKVSKIEEDKFVALKGEYKNISSYDIAD